MNAIAVDLQGNIWFGTFSGVSKFDGTTWTTYDENNGLTFTNISSVAIDLQGTKWFGTYGGGVFRFDGTNWMNYTEANGTGDKEIRFVAPDSQGNIWLLTTFTVVKLEGINFSIC